MAFHDVRLNEDIEKGAQGGPRFKTTVVALASGFERRNIDWSSTRGEWDVGYGLDKKSQFDNIIKFFYARQGMAHGFRFKDWTDFELARQNIGTTNGTLATYQIFKRYTSFVDFDRDIKKPVAGLTQVWVNNVSITEGGGAGEFAVDNATGIITLGSTLAAQSGTAVEVLCEFDVPVRFNTDALDLVADTDTAAAIPLILIIELRV